MMLKTYVSNAKLHWDIYLYNRFGWQGCFSPACCGKDESSVRYLSTTFPSVDSKHTRRDSCEKFIIGKSKGIKQIPNGVPTTVDCTTGVEASEDGGAKYVQGSTSGCGKSTTR